MAKLVREFRGKARNRPVYLEIKVAEATLNAAKSGPNAANVRYNLAPYRYRGQRRTTVMVTAPRKFIDETLWPEFQALSKRLNGFFDALTAEVIADVLQADGRDAEEREAIGAIQG